MKVTNLSLALKYLREVLRGRLQHHFSKRNKPYAIPPLNFKENDNTPFTQFIINYKLTTEELLVVLIGLVPHIVPNLFEQTIAEVLPDGGEFPEFGGVKPEGSRNMMPTGETVLFILAGTDLERRFQIQHLLSMQHFLVREQILYLDQTKSGEPKMIGKLILDPDYVELFTLGNITVPRMSTQFPAQHLTTQLEWSDLILNIQTLNQVRELETWVKHNDTLMYEWGMHRKLKPGYRALFHGPPGTGKTLTATLIGKYTGKNVFKIDLSMVVSKYIGETEKNLANLFDRAQNKDWILFFDEADAIFGKRTNVRDAHDKYANQEVSYLLQRIENYPGLAVLASNFKSNIDEAFLRRFNTIVYFPVPKQKERIKLWQRAFPEQVELSKDVDFTLIAQQYELTGSHIMNIVHQTCLNALDNDTRVISLKDIKRGIAKEFAKEGKRVV